MVLNHIPIEIEMFRNKKILLIDDNHALKFLTRMLLRDENHEGVIDDVSNGLAALEYLGIAENIPDVILLDMNMPKMNGYEFLLEYKKRGLHNNNKTNIYMLTTSTLDEDRKMIMDTGIVLDYFEKPLTEKHIRKIYEDLLVAK